MNDHGEVLTNDILRLKRMIAEQDEDHRRKLAAFDELLAVCRTCEEVIEEYLDTPANKSGPGTQQWINLRAARHLAKRAMENADEFKAKGGA